MHIASKRDFFTALFLIALMGLFYFESGKIDVTGGNDLGPLFFPHIMMISIAFMGVLLLIKSLAFEPPVRSSSENVKKGLNRDQLIFIGMFFIYLLALPFTGYLIATLVYLFINMIFLGKRQSKYILIYLVATIIVTGLIYYIFAKLMLLFLP